MENLSVQRARHASNIGQRIRINAWVRTRRDSKAGFSFVEVNDGSCMDSLQAVADGELENYEAEILEIVNAKL